MSAEHATVFAIKGQAYRVKGWINDSTTGNGLSGTLTALAASITKDDAAAVATVNAPVQVTGQNGRFYLDLTAAEMACFNAGIVVSCSNANQMEAKIDLLCLDLAEITGSWWSQSIKKAEKIWLYGPGYLLQKVKRNKSSGTITVYQQDGSTVVGTMTYEDDGTDVTKGAIG